LSRVKRLSSIVSVTVVNKRKRLDFTDQGYSKVYRYDVQDRNHRPFPAPRGYKFDLGPSKLSCCWVWLVDSDTGDNEEMDEVKIPAKATDRGATTKNGVSVEEWFAKGTVVLAESESDWFVGENSTIVQVNQKIRLKKSPSTTNQTYTGFDASTYIRRECSCFSVALTVGAVALCW